jgi:Zn-dependent protease with chaperone function
MTVPYVLRLLCISLAVFFLVHLAVGTMVLLMAPAAARLVERVRAVNAARILLALRLLPAVGSAFVVIALCIPSFLWFETEAGGEEVGWLCLAAAALGAAVWSVSILRGVRAAIRSWQYVRRCQTVARRLSLPDGLAPIWVLDRPEPYVMLAGLFRPRLVISRCVVDSLTPEQLAAALKHERAHWTGRDNLKRFVLLLAPGLLPCFRGFGRLEKAWARFTEWAADDLAVEGDSQTSISLAGALVRVARLGAAHPGEPLVTSLLADGQDLSARVDRLLRADPPRSLPMSWAAGSAAVPVMLAAAALQPATLRAVHHLIERLIH